MDLVKSYEYFQPESANGRIHIVGCGSVGSTVAENLARCGLTKFTLWDFDKVESKNIVNQMFRASHVGSNKAEVLKQMIIEINPDAERDIEVKTDGWNGKMMSGYIFLCVDNIDIRRKIVEQHMDNPYVIAVFDFRTGLEDAQHYAADWSDRSHKKDLLATMQFGHEEAQKSEQVSACGTTLGLCPTVRLISAYGVANFVNFVKGKPIKKLILVNGFNFLTDAF